MNLFRFFLNEKNCKLYESSSGLANFHQEKRNKFIPVKDEFVGFWTAK